MHLFIVYDGHTIRAFEPDGDGTFLSSFALIIGNRLYEGHYKSEKVELAAETLMDRFDKLNETEVLNKDIEEAFKQLAEDMQNFLLKQRFNEEGELDIVDTEN